MFLALSASMPKVEDFYLGQETPLHRKQVLVTPRILTELEQISLSASESLSSPDRMK